MPGEASHLVLAALFLSGAMAFAWGLQRLTRNSGWIDTVWSFSVGIATILALGLMSGDPTRRLLVALLVLTWSIRLGLHILQRTQRSPDDPRYAELMKNWGRAAPLRLFLFLQIQALAGGVLVLAASLAAASLVPSASPGTVFFALISTLAILGEGVADAQLAQWKRDRPPLGICDRGLWAYSRHPNYFCEWLFWTGIAGMALAPPSGLSALAACLAPAMMYVLLRHGSGVPHIEAHFQRTRPEAFADYARRVPVFFPRLG